MALTLGLGSKQKLEGLQKDYSCDWNDSEKKSGLIYIVVALPIRNKIQLPIGSNPDI